MLSELLFITYRYLWFYHQKCVMILRNCFHRRERLRPPPSRAAMASLCRLLRGGLAQLTPIQTLTRPNHHLASLRCITRSQSTRISSLALLSTRNSHCIGRINNGYTQCHSVVRGMRTSSLLCDAETGNKYFRQTASLFPSLYQVSLVEFYCD